MTPGRFALWMLVVLGILYLTVSGGGGFFGLYLLEFRVASAAIAIAAICAWLAWAIRHERWRPRTALRPVIISGLVALVVSTLASREPRFAYDYLAYAVMLAGLYLLMQRLFADSFFGPRLASLGIVLGFGLSGLYIGIVVLRWIDFWQQLGRFSTPPLRPGFEGLAYGNPSTVATVSILLWLAAAAHLGFSTTRSRVALAVLGAMTAAVVFLSGSRGAWVGLAIAGVILVPMWFAVRDHRQHARRLLSDRRVIRAGAIAAVALAAVSFAFLPALVSRLTEPAADTRTAFYMSALRMFADKPLTGLGPGTWTVERIRYTVAPEADYYIPHAHNIWLQTLAELGLVGALAGVVMLDQDATV
jgi:O-antigen ligase